MNFPISISFGYEARSRTRQRWRTLEMLKEWDWILTFFLVCLCAIGILTVHSATKELDSAGLSARGMAQVVWIAFGAVLMMVFALVDYRSYQKFIVPLYITGIGLLVACGLFGIVVNGSRRWLSILGFRFLPSEVAKLIVLIAVAIWLSRPKTPRSPWYYTLAAFAIAGIPAVIVKKQPDLGTALCILAIPAFLVLVRGVRIWLALLLIASLAGGAFGTRHMWWDRLENHQKERILTLVNPSQADPKGAGYQIMQGKIAVGSGGAFGKGYTQGSQHRLSFLPENHTDFAFAVVAEDWGWSGVVVVLALYMAFLAYGLYIAIQAADLLGMLLASGVVSMIFFEAFVNISMIVGMAPVTGIPLPLISYGGTSMMSTLAAVGILYNVRMRRFSFYK